MYITFQEIKYIKIRLTKMNNSYACLKLRKIKSYLVPTRTMGQNKLLSKPFKQMFHITEIKNKFVGILFITEYVTTINILSNKLHMKVKYTRIIIKYQQKFQRFNKEHSIFSKFYLIYKLERNYLNH